MLNDDLKNFCNRWIEKADNYTSNSTEDVFDRFFSLYVAYNAIYTEATRVLKNKKPKTSTTEYMSATKNITNYIGEERLYLALKNNETDINSIITLIENGTFYIFTKTNVDSENVSAIRNNSSARKKIEQEKYSNALLSLIYGTRCNMFHGSKSFEPIQKELLMPMNNILEMIIKDLLLVEEGRI